jgi:hypothetical protein
MHCWWNVLTLIIAPVNQAATSITLMEAAQRPALQLPLEARHKLAVKSRRSRVEGVRLHAVLGGNATYSALQSRKLIVPEAFGSVQPEAENGAGARLR